ncbi:hypothetical protein [Microbacterium schleiferi]|uniref:Uncharacterized protein n=1 Tax=Microbacterium schleiferi TaxID=69362 RepID=A0ABU7V7E5_9MICO
MKNFIKHLGVKIYGPKPVDLPPDPFGEPPRQQKTTLLEDAIEYQPLPVLPQWG